MLLAVALCLPLVAEAVMIGASMAQDPSLLNMWLLTLVAIVFLIAGFRLSAAPLWTRITTSRSRPR